MCYPEQRRARDEQHARTEEREREGAGDARGGLQQEPGVSPGKQRAQRRRAREPEQETPPQPIEGRERPLDRLGDGHGVGHRFSVTERGDGACPRASPAIRRRSNRNRLKMIPASSA
jgi:hypothetical protein